MEWNIIRKEHEEMFVKAIHELDMIKVRGEAEIDTWEIAIKMQEDAINQLFEHIPALKHAGVKIDLMTNITPMLDSRKQFIMNIEKHRVILEKKCATILHVGDAYMNGDSTMEEFHMAKQDIDLAMDAFQKDSEWNYSQILKQQEE